MITLENFRSLVFICSSSHNPNINSHIRKKSGKNICGGLYRKFKEKTPQSNGKGGHDARPSFGIVLGGCLRAFVFPHI
jgi:hypothetical protein